MLGYATESLEIGDLPIVSFDMRATHLFQRMRGAMKNIKPVVFGWRPKPGSGWQIGIRLFKLNAFPVILQISLAAVTAVLFYAPAFFLKRLVAYLETDPLRLHRGWGVVYALGLFLGGVVLALGGFLVPEITPFRLLIAVIQHLVNSGPLVLRLYRSDCGCNSIPSCFPRPWSERISRLRDPMIQQETGMTRGLDQPPEGTPKRHKMISLRRRRL